MGKPDGGKGKGESKTHTSCAALRFSSAGLVMDGLKAASGASCTISWCDDVRVASLPYMDDSEALIFPVRDLVDIARREGAVGVVVVVGIVGFAVKKARREELEADEARVLRREYICVMQCSKCFFCVFLLDNLSCGRRPSSSYFNASTL